MSTLERLMRAGTPGGLSTSVDETAWRELVEAVAETLDVGPGSTVFDVSCGTGALLYPFHENGYNVGGLDPSVDLIALARAAMPDGRFTVGPPGELDPGDGWHAVISASFAGFPDLDYARGVIARMAAKAIHGIAIVGLPEARFDRKWMLRALAEVGASAIQFEALKLEGFGEAPNYFNAFART